MWPIFIIMHDLLGVYFSKETNSSCWQIFNAIKNFFLNSESYENDEKYYYSNYINQVIHCWIHLAIKRFIESYSSLFGLVSSANCLVACMYSKEGFRTYSVGPPKKTTVYGKSTAIQAEISKVYQGLWTCKCMGRIWVRKRWAVDDVLAFCLLCLEWLCCFIWWWNISTTNSSK